MTDPVFVLANARLVDPASSREAMGSVLVENGAIRDVAWGERDRASPPGARVLDCGGGLLLPGIVDLRAFVGEPGAEHRETLATASAAAAAGGVTTLVCRPDTDPPIDEPAMVDFVLRRARDNSDVRVIPSAAITKGLRGEDLAEIGLLREAGAAFVTDGAHSVRSARVMRRALAYARDHGTLVVHHARDADLAAGGVMNEGERASRLGLSGIPREAETITLQRDISLVRLTGARLHAALISCAESVALVARAKAEGLPVTCGVSINHLTLNENDVGDYRTFLKLDPPLRGEADRIALVAAVSDGMIDVVVSDHDPQDVDTKRQPFAEAANGAIGLETMLAAGLRLVHSGEVSLMRLVQAMTARPADIVGLPQGRLAPGAPADLIVVDPDHPFVLDPETLHSRCRNTPFDGARMQGRVLTTMVAGRIVRHVAEPPADR